MSPVLSPGMKIKELIDSGKITADQAKIGYVGAFPFAEVISGFTAFYLGARSIVPEVTMTVKYVSSWSDATAEGNAAQALCDEGCVLISQHSDNTTPATVAQQNGVFHVGYNNDMTGIAPEASLLSSRIDWSVYFEYVFDCLVNGETIAKDWTAGMKDGAVVVTELNEAIAAEGTADKIAEVEAGLADGSIHVFQGPWKGEGTAYGARRSRHEGNARRRLVQGIRCRGRSDLRSVLLLGHRRHHLRELIRNSISRRAEAGEDPASVVSEAIFQKNC